MKRPGNAGLLVGIAGLALTGVLSLALIWDRLPTDSASWPGAAERAGARAREQARAEQAAEAWSRTVNESLVCGGDMATLWARSPVSADGEAADLATLGRALRPLAERCRQRLPSLREVWLLPAPGRTDEAQAVLSDSPSATLGRVSERTRARLRDAAETEGDQYAVGPADGAGVDQIVPVRRRAGALLLLRLRPEPVATEEAAPLRVLDEQTAAQGVPIRDARGLRVAIASDAAERQWLSSVALGLMVTIATAVGWHNRGQRRLQRALQSHVQIAELATLQARTAEEQAQSERAQAETANEGLRREIDLRQAIEAASPVGLRVIDPQCRIIAVNNAFCEAAGQTREALLGQGPPYSFWPTEAHEELRSHLDDVLAGRSKDEGYRVEFMQASGSRWKAHVRATALQGGRGWLLTSQDITDAERRQKHIDRLHAELQRQGDSLLMGERALQLVHDLKTPAKAIDYAAYNLQQLGRSNSPESLRLELAVIREQVVCQYQLIKQFARQVKGELVYEPCDLAKIVDDAIALQSRQATLCNADLINQVNKRHPTQLLARMNLLQVLLNLIGNGLQWMESTPAINRRVVVYDVLLTDPPSLEHPRGRQWLHLTVKDSGCGIPPHQYEEIFESGFSTRDDGQGLGLWLCRRWIERMGGRIAVRKSSPRGTSMSVVLPFQPVPEDAHADAV